MKHCRFTGRAVLSSTIGAMLWAVVGAVLWTGCSRNTTNASLPFETPTSFTARGSEALPEKWWTAFGDPLLDSLVERALQDNLDLETAWERLQAARAVADRESASLFPSAEASVGGEVGRAESGTAEPGDIHTLQLGLSSSYEIDLWGRLRSARLAEAYRFQASREDYRTAALSLSAEVAVAWFGWLVLSNQLDLLQRQVEINEKTMELLESSFGGGQIRSVDLLRQKGLLEATREQKIVVEMQASLLEHQLAILMGKPPRTKGVYRKDSLPQPPPLPETGLPSGLIQRRPDVRRAFHQLQAADRDLAAAVSNRYPRLTLTGRVSTDYDGGEFLDNWLASLMGNLVAPLVDGGRRRAEARRSQAVKRQRLHEYARTVLAAFREVEDALVREEKQRERLQNLQTQVELAENTYEQLRFEYFNGASGYIDVLLALTDLQRLRRELLTARADLLVFRVALYRALSGGFETTWKAKNTDAKNREVMP